MKGNVVDMAVGVIIEGAAFGKIVSSLVADVIMPSIRLYSLERIDFKQFSLVLREAHGDIPAVILNYGAFIQTVFDFCHCRVCYFLCD